MEKERLHKSLIKVSLTNNKIAAPLLFRPRLRDSKTMNLELQRRKYVTEFTVRCHQCNLPARISLFKFMSNRIIKVTYDDTGTVTYTELL